MAVAAVTFSRSSLGVRLSLAIEGTLVFDGSDITKMVCTLAANGVTELWVTSAYSIKLPTNNHTLAEAAKQPLDESLATFILISECAW